MEVKDYSEAILWFTLACTEAEAVIDIRTTGDLPLLALADCEDAIGHPKKAEEYRQLAKEWELPAGD